MIKSIALRRFSPFVSDIIITSVATVVDAVCNILLVRIIAKGLGPEEFGAFTLVRRTVATLLPFTSLSIGIGLARYIALYTADGRSTDPLLPAAVMVSSIFSLLFCLLLFPFSGVLSDLIFNQERMEILFKLILFLLVGENLYDCLYSYYRGRGEMRYANIWQLLVLGIMPVSIVMFFVHMSNVSYIIFGLGLLFYFSVFILLPKSVQGVRKTTWKELKVITKKLLAYSILRAPGGVALSLIFTFGVLASPYLGGIANAAYMSIAIWIFQILQTATTPFGLIMLPKAANFLGSGSEGYLKEKLRSIYDFILDAGLFIVIQLYLVADFLIIAWLGLKYSEAVPIARIIILSMMPFLFYTMMRSIIDAVEKRAINTFNLYLSLLMTVTSSLVLLKFHIGLSALAIGLGTGLCLLGVMTYLYMKRRYHVRLMSGLFYRILLINILFGCFVYLVKYVMLSNHFNYQNVAIVFSIQLFCGVLYLILLRKLDATWIREIVQRVSFRRT